MVQLYNHGNDNRRFFDQENKKFGNYFFIIDEGHQINGCPAVMIKYQCTNDKKWYTTIVTTYHAMEILKFGIHGEIKLKSDLDHEEWIKQKGQFLTPENASKCDMLKGPNRTSIVKHKFKKIMKKRCDSKIKVIEFDETRDDPRKCFVFQSDAFFNYKLCEVDHKRELFKISFEIIDDEKEIKYSLCISPRDMALLAACEIEATDSDGVKIDENYFRQKKYPFLDFDAIYHL